MSLLNLENNYEKKLEKNSRFIEDSLIEYTDKEFPIIKTKGKHILFEYDFKAITKELLEELKVLRLYRKDKRIDNLLYLINSFIGDIECKHYVFNIIEEGD